MASCSTPSNRASRSPFLPVSCSAAAASSRGEVRGAGKCTPPPACGRRRASPRGPSSPGSAREAGHRFRQEDAGGRGQHDVVRPCGLDQAHNPRKPAFKTWTRATVFFQRDESARAVSRAASSSTSVTSVSSAKPKVQQENPQGSDCPRKGAVRNGSPRRNPGFPEPARRRKGIRRSFPVYFFLSFDWTFCFRRRLRLRLRFCPWPDVRRGLSFPCRLSLFPEGSSPPP